MINTDGVCGIVPDTSIPDEELRALKCFDEALEAATRYLVDIYDARNARDAHVVALEEARDAILELKHGFMRAGDRRRKELGVLVAKPVARLAGARR
jgi:hypothetical protein